MQLSNYDKGDIERIIENSDWIEGIESKEYLHSRYEHINMTLMINDGRRAKGLIHLCIPSIFSVPAALGDRFLWCLFILSLPTTLTVRLLFANERQKYD